MLLRIFLATAIFSIYFWKDANIIAPTEDEAYYIFDRNNKVLDIVKTKEPETKYDIILSGCKKNITKQSAIISRNLPPILSLEIGEETFPIIIWPHITFVTYLPQAIALYVGEKFSIPYVITEKIFNYILIVLTMIALFFTVSVISNKNTAFLSILIYGLFASTKFFGAIGISIDFIFHTLYILLSFYFIELFSKNGRKILLFLSSLFCGLAILSYLKFSSLLTMIIWVMISLKNRKFKDSLIFSIIPALFILLFYIIPSVYVSDCEPTNIESLRTTLNLIRSTSIYTSAAIADLNNLKLLIYDIMRMVDLTGYGKRLDYYDNLDFRFLPALPLILSFIYEILSNIRTRSIRNIATFILIFNTTMYLELPVEGYHRKLRPIFPFLSILIGKFIFSLFSAKKKYFYFAALSILTWHIYFQLKKDSEIFESLKTKGKWSIIHHIDTQREIVDFLKDKKEKEEAKIINFSAPINLEIISNSRFIDIDFSYFLHFSGVVMGKKKYGLIEMYIKKNFIILKTNEKKRRLQDIAIETIKYLSKKYNGKIYIIADPYGYELLKPHFHEKKIISFSNNAIFYIF